jgi:hypothetical protein
MINKKYRIQEAFFSNLIFEICIKSKGEKEKKTKEFNLKNLKRSELAEAIYLIKHLYFHESFPLVAPDGKKILTEIKSWLDNIFWIKGLHESADLFVYYQSKLKAKSKVAIVNLFDYDSDTIWRE